jgi:hypothetical protein
MNLYTSYRIVEKLKLHLTHRPVETAPITAGCVQNPLGARVEGYTLERYPAGITYVIISGRRQTSPDIWTFTPCFRRPG